MAEAAIATENRSDSDLLALVGLPTDVRGQVTETEVELSEEEKKFQEERRSILGGTDVAAIAGQSSYRNLWDVVAEKKGLLPPFVGTERMAWGLLLEDPVVREYARRTGQRLRRVNQVVRDRDLPFLGGHPDRLVIGARKGVEAKTVEFGREKWSEPGMPIRVPPDYYIQCQHYMGVLRFDRWDLVALFGLSRMRWYELEANPRVISALRERAEEVWERYVVGPEMPPLEPSERAAAWLRQQHPEQTSETIVVANELQAEAIARWREAKKNREAWAEREDKWKLHVQQAIGDATGIVAGDVTVTWKRNRDTAIDATDWEGMLREYAARLGFEIDAQDIVRFTRRLITKQGARVMRVKEAA